MASPSAPPAPRGVSGTQPLGPLDDSFTPPLLSKDVEELQRNLKADAGNFAVTIDAASISGLLRPFNTRARHILVSLLRGYSVGMAATAAGVSTDSVRTWGKKHPEWAEAVEAAREWGFRRVFESELQRRALAGSEDRGSMRALELVVKRSDPEYREKSQVQFEVLHRAERATDALTAGWAPSDDTSTSIEAEQ